MEDQKQPPNLRDVYVLTLLSTEVEMCSNCYFWTTSTRRCGAYQKVTRPHEVCSSWRQR